MEPAGPSTTSLRTSDLDEARVVCGDFFAPRSMRLLDRSARLAARFDIMHAGAVTIGDVEYGAEITGRCEDLAAYHVNVPVTGGFTVRQGRRGVEASTSRASVFRPNGRLTLERASPDCRILTVQIDRHALEGHLESLLDAPVRGPLRMPIGLDLTTAIGRGWACLVEAFAADITDEDALARHPMMAVPLRETLLTAALVAIDHQYRCVLDRAREERVRCDRADRRIGIAVEAIRTHPEQPFTASGLADLAGVSHRRMLLGFRRRFGATPMAHLWETRLSRAHDDLRAADPRSVTVRSVAARWGFPYVRRFAAAYRARYHVDPKQTLCGPHAVHRRTP